MATERKPADEYWPTPFYPSQTFRAWGRTWGRYGESGYWLAPRATFRLRMGWKYLYLAIGKFRFRLEGRHD